VHKVRSDKYTALCMAHPSYPNRNAWTCRYVIVFFALFV
jgi:hypothetical protein